jgi:hypothetical protein
MLNSRVGLCVTTSKGSELHERWPHFCWQVNDLLLSLMPLRFRANVTPFPSGCSNPKAQEWTPKNLHPSSCNSLGSTKIVGLWLDVCVWSDVQSNQRISRLFLSLFSICYHSSFSISPSFPTFYHSCKSLGKKNKISVQRWQTMVSMRFLYQLD